MACSRMIWIHFINISSLILGLISIAWSLYTIVHGPTETLIYPLLIPGALITILSLSGLIGFGCCKSNVLIVINMVVIILAIVVVAVLTSLGFMAATTIRNGMHPSDSDLGFKEYRFGNYSNLFGRNISDNLYWNRVKTKYLIKAKVCSRLKDVNVTAGETLNHLTSIQSGCCVPPISCGFKYQNITYWTGPPTGPENDLKDCFKWSNNPMRFCYDCDSCKAAYLHEIRKEWKFLVNFYAALLVLLIVLLVTSCCAFKSNRKHKNVCSNNPYGRMYV